MECNKIRTAYCCEIETLSPLHVGNGENYVKGLDFLTVHNTLKFFDRTRLFEIVEKAGSEAILGFSDAIETQSVEQWLQESKIPWQEAVKFSAHLNHHHTPRDIKVQLRTGHGLPLVPGSSLKGALRTAVLSRLDADQGHVSVGKKMAKIRKNVGKYSQHSLKFMDSDITRELLGPNPNNNLMRTLSVGDFAFEKRAAGINTVFVYSLYQGHRIARKKINNTHFDMKIVAETITPGMTADGQISFDDFLGHESGKGHFLSTEQVLDVEWLVQAIRLKTSRTIKGELEFFRGKHGNCVQDLQNFYNELQRKQDELKDNEAIIQMSWGSGWRGITGELIQRDELTRDIREKLRLAPNRLDCEFPKSRKIALSQEGYFPMGWILIRFDSKEEIRKRQEEDRQKRIQEETAAREREKLQQVWDEKSEQEKYLYILKKESIALEFARKEVNDPITFIWPKLDEFEGEEQKALAQAFKEWWEKEPSTWRKKKCTPGQWGKVERLLSILEIDHPDVQKISEQDKELVERISNLKDWGAYKSSGINMKDLSRPAAEALLAKLRQWGCDKKKAKKDKIKAFKEVKAFIRTLPA